jgi:hypothetical protein
VIEGDYFRGAQGRSGEIGFLPVSSPETQARSLQEVVSLSALYAHLEAGGVVVDRPDQLTDLSPKGQALVEDWIALSARLLVQPFVSISCLVNPEAIYVGGRLPTALLDRLVAAVNDRLAADRRRAGPGPGRAGRHLGRRTGRGRGPAAVHGPAAALPRRPDEDRRVTLGSSAHPYGLYGPLGRHRLAFAVLGVEHDDGAVGGADRPLLPGADMAEIFAGEVDRPVGLAQQVVVRLVVAGPAHPMPRV